MYTIVGGFSKKIESVMESIHFMTAHCTILVLIHILVFNSCSSLFVTPERFTSTVIWFFGWLNKKPIQVVYQELSSIQLHESKNTNVWLMQYNFLFCKQQWSSNYWLMKFYLNSWMLLICFVHFLTLILDLTAFFSQIFMLIN